MRLIFIISIIIIIIQNDYIDSYRSKTKIPLIMNTEASQLITTRNIPRRWRQQYLINQPSNEIDRSLKQLQLINENGIRQFDTQSFDSVPMEIIYEFSRTRLKN